MIVEVGGCNDHGVVALQSLFSYSVRIIMITLDVYLIRFYLILYQAM